MVEPNALRPTQPKFWVGLVPSCSLPMPRSTSCRSVFRPRFVRSSLVSNPVLYWAALQTIGYYFWLIVALNLWSMNSHRLHWLSETSELYVEKWIVTDEIRRGIRTAKVVRKWTAVLGGLTDDRLLFLTYSCSEPIVNEKNKLIAQYKLVSHPIQCFYASIQIAFTNIYDIKFFWYTSD